MEAKTARLRRDAEAASASGDIGLLMSVLCKTTERSMHELIDSSLGPYVMAYFAFLDTFHAKPRDLEELVDGLLYLDLRNIQQERITREVESKRGRMGSSR